MDGDAGADGVAVGYGADEVQSEPMVLVFGEVDEEHGVVAEVVDDGFDASVVEEVGGGKAAAGTRVGQGGAGGFADVLELDWPCATDAAEVVVEEAGFAIEGAQLGGVNLGIDVAVDDEEVGPAVVVDVGEHGAPAEGVGVDGEACGVGLVGEGTVAVGVVEGGGVVGEIGFEDVEVAVTVVVG